MDEAERTERAPQQCLNKGRTGRRSNETKEETNHTRKEGGNTTMCVPKSQIDVCAVKCPEGQKKQNESDRGVTSRVGTTDAI